MDPDRRILHVDMDAFFASVEQLDDSRLRGRPVLVGHDGSRGVVAAASYEARAFGCRSAMPMAVARRLCPHALVAPVRMGRYREVSAKVFAVFDQYAPVVEPLSIDEAFLDVTGTAALLGDAEAAARRIRADVLAQTGCTASVGVAANKFLAKLASDMDKPDGLTVLLGARVEQVLPGLPVERVWGIGPKTAERLRGVGVRTVGDLRRMPADWMAARFGNDAERVGNLARGLDTRPVVPDAEAKSIGQERTFGTDVGSPAALLDVLVGEVEEVAARVRRHGLLARRVTLKIRSGEFKTVTRSKTLAEPTEGTGEMWGVARELFDTWRRTGFFPVRLLGVTAGDLSRPGAQLGLFTDPAAARARGLDRAVDALNAKFGKGMVRRGKDNP